MEPIRLNTVVTGMRQTEVLLALGIVSLIILFFMPLPSFALDMLFAMNITLGLMVLLTVLFVQRALDFTAFPMLLLVTTTFRLALNVASTRLILTDGHQSTAAAGKIIETFGEVIIGGNFIIGIIIFLILIIVNFVVITKGSGRIAEVAARFTLDSLPGKQMAIDADLNAGLITEDDARLRRKELEQETGFFGAMDGASKFVRGDAIAGLIITGLNIAVGIIIGTTQHGMDIAEAANRYTVLTVGDGLVAYIPALTISIAAGILVAKSGTIDTAGRVLFDQILQNEKALLVACGLMFSISLLPNMPVLPFWSLSAVLGFSGYYVWQQKQKMAAMEAQAEAMETAEAAAEETTPTEEPISSVLHIDTLRLELGYSLLGLIDESKGGRLTEQIKAMRRQMARDIGFVVPSIRIQDNMQLQGGEYIVSIKDIEAGRGTLQPGRLLAMDPTGTATPIEGEDTIEPTFNLPAKWIDSSKREEASFNGYTVVDASTVVVTHITEVIKDNLADLLTRSELEKLLEELHDDHGKLIDELIPEKVSMGMLQKVLQNLLKERISVRDLPTILEALSDLAAGTRNISQLTEQVRQRLSRQLSTQYAGQDGVINLISLSPAWEEEFRQSVTQDGDERQLAMAPDKVQALLKSLRDTFEKHMLAGVNPVLLTSAFTRPFARSLTERALPTLSVMSQAEIHPKAKIKTIGTV